MSKCYPGLYFEWDRRQLGYMFEQCDELFHNLYKKHINIVKFINEFMNSDCRKAMEEGNTHLLSVGVENLMEDYINVDLNGDYSMFVSDKDETGNYAYKQLFWVGWYYAYIHWLLKVSSRDIMKVQPAEKAIDQWLCGHQLSFEGIVSRVVWMFEKENIPVDMSLLRGRE